MDATIRDARRGGYETARPDVQALVPRAAERILDLGCASGALGAALKARQGAEVVGIELDPGYARDAEDRLDRVVCADVVAGLEEDLGTFDCVVAADVLEHLVDPWDALRRATALLRPGGVAVVSVPNVRSWETFRELGWRGRWPRRPAGLFDATHLRWFALADARELLEQAGLRVDAVEGQLWFEGRQRSVARLLARTPLEPFLYGQYVLRGVARG
ncbi:MAG TPA: class I SAM-dependent methyltransferase [Solirubrobacteraceae bacterium]|jgi:2-polyprenyl-3-methyl-5-hydroxy-6-metoxy-1,4-benzoquinol methylase